MSQENNELSKLMKDLQKMQQDKQPSAPPVSAFEDMFILDNSDTDDVMDSSTPLPLPDITQTVQAVLQALQPYRLTPKAEQIITEFITFRIQTKQRKDDLPEGCHTYYNLLLRTEIPQDACAVAQILQQALQLQPFQYAAYSEKELLEKFSNAQPGPNGRTKMQTPWLSPTAQLILVHSCQGAPVIDSDLPSATSQDRNRKEVANYQQMWQALLSRAKDHPEISLIVSGDADAYRNAFQQNTELFFRVCGHHVFLQTRSDSEYLQECLNVLKNSSFTLSEDFEEALTNYFHTVYPKAELRHQAFVDDLIQRIYALFFCKKREGNLLTPDCIPLYNTQTLSPEDILSQMDELIGLYAVKKEFRNIYQMQLAGLNSNGRPRYHMLFSGSPGTGKTTVAKMAADLFYRMGILQTNKLVVAKPHDFVSEWVAGTGKKTKELIKRAYGGVLFIDEAYGLANGERGAEVLNYLIQEMENNANRLIVIFAGYQEEMHQLLSINPGLSSRIGREIIFEDYSLEELVRIFHFQCKKDGFSLDPSAADLLEDCISARMSREFFGNARDISNLLRSLKEAWSAELYTANSPQEHKVFYPNHFEALMPPKKEMLISDLVGLSTLKEKLEVFHKQVLYQKHLREKGISPPSVFSMHMLFTGNPGTGKTTVAQLIADDLYTIGVLKSNRLVVAERKDLVSSVIGQTAKKAAALIRKAVGGVLFVDEAYSLAGGNGDLGHEVIEVFLTAMEEHKADTVFIFAGYPNEMQTFLAMNPGIQSRIGYTFHFEDYTPEELTKMFGSKLKKAGFSVSEEALKKANELMEYFHEVKNFGNGRFVDHVIQQTISQRATRNFSEQYQDITEADIPTVKTLIATAPNSLQLYDPANITAQEQHRTAIHELGHAVVLCVTDPEAVPQSISIKNRAGSLGRVRRSDSQGNDTEQALLNTVAVLLSGKNAEKLLLGDHSTGCSSDYAHAKHIAQSMIEMYAMDCFGNTPAQILQAADQRSMEILTNHKDFLDSYAHVLLEKREITGTELVRALACASACCNDTATSEHLS